MRKLRANTGIWKYLAECGVLENGTEEQIKAARKAYKKKYILAYKRKQRGELKEITVLLNKEESAKVSEQAKKHQLTVVSFLKTAALAYLEKKYIVPNKEQVAHIEQTLIQILNEIQVIAKRNKILFGLNPLSIERRINRMEAVINDTLRNPPLQINSPNNDSQNQNPQDTILQADS